MGPSGCAQWLLRKHIFWCLVAMETSGCLFPGCGLDVLVEEPWVPSLMPPSLHSSVGAPGRRPVPQERALESCVLKTMAQHVALTAEVPSPEPVGPSGWRGRWPSNCRVSTPSSSRPGTWWVKPRQGRHTSVKAKAIEPPGQVSFYFTSQDTEVQRG